MLAEGDAVTVVVAERDPLHLHGFVTAVRGQPRLQILQIVRSGRRAVEAIAAQRPDVALIDAGMTDLQAPMILYALKHRDQVETKVVFTMEDPGSDVGLRLVGAGAAGCLLKSAGWERICTALLAVARGEVAAAPDLGVVCGSGRLGMRAEGLPRLSEPDLRMLRLVAEGLTAPQIAARCERQPAQVRQEIARLCERLGAEERLGAVAEALRRDLLP